MSTIFPNVLHCCCWICDVLPGKLRLVSINFYEITLVVNYLALADFATMAHLSKASS